MPSWSMLPVWVKIVAPGASFIPASSISVTAPFGADVNGLLSESDCSIVIGVPVNVYESLIVSELSGMYWNVKLKSIVFENPLGKIAWVGKTTSEKAVVIRTSWTGTA